ncbi:probable serine/threonine-protein kinase StkP [Coccomyxa sp. Obi]|nr:probable serine/threonine-protein kinase StkP [Coccomyxa sp. Obi]
MLPLRSHMSKEEPQMVSCEDERGRKSSTVKRTVAISQITHLTQQLIEADKAKPTALREHEEAITKVKAELQAALDAKVASLLELIKSKDEEKALLESKLAFAEKDLLQQTAHTSQIEKDCCLLQDNFDKIQGTMHRLLDQQSSDAEEKAALRMQLMEELRLEQGKVARISGEVDKRDAALSRLRQSSKLCRLPEGSCTLGDQLGKGGLSDVHSAKVTMDLAVKVPSHQEGAVEELQNEADTLASLPEHPNIITAIGWAPLENSPDGLLLEKAVCNLAEFIEDGPAEALDAVAVLGQVAEGLSHVHAHNYVHRDLKLENVLLFSDDSVKLADFGCAIRIGAPCTEFRGTTLHATPLTYAEPGTFGTHDDKRGLCTIALQLLCGTSIRTALRNQFDELSDSDKDRANAELCRIKGLPARTDPIDFYDIEQAAAAEHLGLIGIQEVVPLHDGLPAYLLEDILLGLQDPQSLSLDRLKASIDLAVAQLSPPSVDSDEEEDDEGSEECWCSMSDL